MIKALLAGWAPNPCMSPAVFTIRLTISPRGDVRCLPAMRALHKPLTWKGSKPAGILEGVCHACILMRTPVVVK